MTLLDFRPRTAPANPFLPRHYARPERVTRDQWQLDVDNTLLSLEPWVVCCDGRLFSKAAPGPLVAKWNALQAFGRERGWGL